MSSAVGHVLTSSDERQNPKMAQAGAVRSACGRGRGRGLASALEQSDDVEQPRGRALTDPDPIVAADPKPNAAEGSGDNGQNMRVIEFGIPIAGFVLYGASYIVSAGFYRAFDETPSSLGIAYTNLIFPAVLLSIIVVPLAALIARLLKHYVWVMSLALLVTGFFVEGIAIILLYITTLVAQILYLIGSRQPGAPNTLYGLSRSNTFFAAGGFLSLLIWLHVLGLNLGQDARSELVGAELEIPIISMKIPSMRAEPVWVETTGAEESSVAIRQRRLLRIATRRRNGSDRALHP